QQLTPNLEQMTAEIVAQLEMPELITEPTLAVESLVERYPEVKADFDGLQEMLQPSEEEQPEQPEAAATSESDELRPEDRRRTLAFSKLLLNVLGPNTLTGTVSAAQYSQWCRDVGWLEGCFGHAPGGLRGKRGAAGAGTEGTGSGHAVSEQELKAGLAVLEA